MNDELKEVETYVDNDCDFTTTYFEADKHDDDDDNDLITTSETHLDIDKHDEDENYKDSVTVNLYSYQ